MTEHVANNEGPVSISANAVSRIAFLKDQENQPDALLRVSVSGGGCSGFQYGFGFDQEVKDDDIVIEADKAAVVIDSMSLMYLSGSEIDYVEDLIGSFFSVKNPNASATCGCGTSFSV